jgi:hypothetical protein
MTPARCAVAISEGCPTTYPSVRSVRPRCVSSRIGLRQSARGRRGASENGSRVMVERILRLLSGLYDGVSGGRGPPLACGSCWGPCGPWRLLSARLCCLWTRATHRVLPPSLTLPQPPLSALAEVITDRRAATQRVQIYSLGIASDGHNRSLYGLSQSEHSDTDPTGFGRWSRKAFIRPIFRV